MNKYCQLLIGGTLREVNTHKGDYNMKSTETKKKANTQYLKFNNLELSLGNSKLGDDTIIFNMGSAWACPSRSLGLCKLGSKCYALKAEIQHPVVSVYRRRQQAYWLNNTAWDIGNDIINALKSKRTRVNGKLVPLIDKVKYFRFNESGDFHSQACVTKLDIIASMLAYYNITTYGYTARADLDVSGCNFLCKGSGHDNGNNGKTIARAVSKLIKHKVNLDAYYTENNELFSVCPMDCTICDMCKIRDKLNIVFPLH